MNLQSSSTPQMSAWIVSPDPHQRHELEDRLAAATGVDTTVRSARWDAGLDPILNRQPPALLFLDWEIVREQGIGLVARLKRTAETVALILIGGEEDPTGVFRTVCAGASGYVSRHPSDDELRQCLQEASNSNPPITPRIARLALSLIAPASGPAAPDYGLSCRELDVMGLMVQGLAKKEIAARLGLSVHTADHHLRSIYAKLHVHTRGGAVAKAVSEHLFRSAQ